MSIDRFLSQFNLSPMMRVHFENYIYPMADRMVEGYTGGTWGEVKLGNVWVLVIPSKDDRVTVNSEFNSADMDKATAGAAFTFFLVSEFWNRFNDRMGGAAQEAFEATYFGIRDAAYTDGSGIDQKSFYKFTD